MENVTPQQAVEILFSHAIHSRNLPPAALPELQNLVRIVTEALTSKVEIDNG